MADRKVDDIVEQTEILNKAVWLKWNKFTWSGLLIIGIGIVLIVVGWGLNTGFYSTEGLLLGFGAIVVIVGLIRVLIGLINPPSPEELHAAVVPDEAERILGQDETE